ncbi:MAG: TetR/AcrR family transcriptional regulator [Patulibacter minatonensis]
MARRAPDPRTVRTRAAILDAATTLLNDASSEHASIARIADAAGVSVGSVYLHFDHRDALIAQMIETAFVRQHDRFASAREAARPGLDRVLAFGDAFIAFALAEPVAFRSLAVRALEPPPPERRSASPAFDEHLRLLAADLHEARGAGEIADLPVDATLIVLVGIWTGIAEQLVRRDDRAIEGAPAVAAILQLGRSVVLAGLRPVATA